MNIYLNTVSANLLIWETNEAKRNTNNEIKLYGKSDLKEGDLIIGNYAPERISVYTITKVKDHNESKIKGFDHFVCESSHQFVGINFFKEKDLSQTNKAFEILINGKF